MRAHTELGGGGEWSEAVTIVDKSIWNNGSCSNNPPSTTDEMKEVDTTSNNNPPSTTDVMNNTNSTDGTLEEEEDTKSNNNPPSTTDVMNITNSTDGTLEEEEDTKSNAAIEASMILKWQCLLVPYLLKFYI